VPGSYPIAPESYLLRNDKGKFTNVTGDLAVGLKNAGMITDALWTDFDRDGKVDLMVVGEFMSIKFYRNSDGRLTLIENSGLEKYTGWWNSIAAADFDADGDTDYVVGNLGLNNYYHISENQPLRVYAKDFDSNGSTDAVLSCYFKSEEGDMREYPVHFWDELNAQSPKFRNQFSSYKQYGSTTMANLLKPYDTTGMLVLTANYSQTSYVRNDGSGKFSLSPLPKLVQVAPVNGMVAADLNRDGNMDVVMMGNDYGNEVFSGRYDAGSGAVLLGNGKGEFSAVPFRKSGFKVDGDAKSLGKLRAVDGSDLFIATQNLDSLRIFRTQRNSEINQFFNPLPSDSHAELEHGDGRKEKVEFYYGSGYLSQSSRSIRVPSSVTKMHVFDYKGNQRTLEYNHLVLESKN
jgi:hypothetical protein